MLGSDPTLVIRAKESEIAAKHGAHLTHVDERDAFGLINDDLADVLSIPTGRVRSQRFAQTRQKTAIQLEILSLRPRWRRNQSSNSITCLGGSGSGVSFDIFDCTKPFSSLSEKQ